MWMLVLQRRMRKMMKEKTTRKQFEVDFVVNQGSQRYYIQVAYDMASEEKAEAGI